MYYKPTGQEKEAEGTKEKQNLTHRGEEKHPQPPPGVNYPHLLINILLKEAV